MTCGIYSSDGNTIIAGAFLLLLIGSVIGWNIPFMGYIWPLPPATAGNYLGLWQSVVGAHPPGTHFSCITNREGTQILTRGTDSTIKCNFKANYSVGCS